MTLNVPYKIRAILYLITALGTPIVTYLLAKNIIGDLEMALWGAEVTVVSAIAALNTAPNQNEIK